MKKLSFGFTAKLAVLLALLALSCEQPVESPLSPLPAQARLEDAVVSGIVNYPLTEWEISLSFSGQTLLMPISADKDLSDWISNLPVGLEARSKDLVPSDGQAVTIVISGTPLEERDAAIALVIPEGVLTDYKALPAAENGLARFNIVKADAIVEDVTVTGVIEGASVIQSVNSDIVIRLFEGAGVLSAGINAGNDLSGWIKNLPQGLSAKAKETAVAGNDKITVNITGDPNKGSTNIIDITIPAGFLSSAKDTDVYRSENARYGIIDLEDVGKAAMLAEVTVNGARNFYDELGLARPDISFIWKRDTPIQERSLTITLAGERFNAIAQNSDLSGWIKNLPQGLSARAKDSVAAGAESLTLVISGKPQLARSAAIALTIPAYALQGGGDLAAVINTGARFAIVDPTANLPRSGGNGTDSEATVVGTKGGGQIVPATVAVTVSGDTLAEPHPVVGADLSPWFENLPAGLNAALSGIIPDLQGKIYITITVSGSPAAGDEKGIAEFMKITLPETLLKCGVPIKVMPEPSAKFVIAATEMTQTEARLMIQLNAGQVTTMPAHTFAGGIPAYHGGSFPREPGPFYFTTSPITIPVANLTWDNPAPADIPRFKISKYEVTRELWYDVYNWAFDNGYSFGGYAWNDPAGSNKKFFPQAYISCQEAVIWCNARSERENKTPVYYKDAGFTEILRDKSVGSYSDLHIKPGADGYRVPTPAQWEYAARGGNPGAAAWNWRWPADKNLLSSMSASQVNELWLDKLSVRFDNSIAKFTPETLEYMWVDEIRLYDVYDSTIQVGILKPNAAGIHDMGGNLHEWTVKTDSFDSSQTITRGGAFNRDILRSAFDSQREERKWGSSRDVIGLRVLCDVEDEP